MIYLTVGTYPGGFDRLVETIDKLCGIHEIECIAQIGVSSYKPVNLDYRDFFMQEEHLNNIENAKFIITHGGFGIIGDIMRMQKPMIIAPRKPGEGPNDQIEMAKNISEMHDIPLCLEIKDLEQLFLSLLNMKDEKIIYNFNNNVSSIISDYLKNH